MSQVEIDYADWQFAFLKNIAIFLYLVCLNKQNVMICLWSNQIMGGVENVFFFNFFKNWNNDWWTIKLIANDQF